MIEKLERIASVSEVPGCITSVVVDARPELAASVVHAVGHMLAIIGKLSTGALRPWFLNACDFG